MEPEVKDTEVKEVADTPQYTEAETKAMNDGWVPKDQWQGDPEDWVPARQFLKNGELFGRINTYKHKIQNLEKSVTALVKHNETVFDAGYKAAEAELKAQRREALRDGDVEAVEKIEEKLDELKVEREEKKEEFKQEVQAPAMHPSWEPWVERNSWYSQDAALRGYADGIASDIVASAQRAGRSIEFDKLLTEVSRKVKEQFPNKFGTQSVQRTSVKDDSSAGAAAPTKKQARMDEIEATMSPMEIDMMNTIIRSGVSKEKYLQDYKRVQGKKR